MQIPIENIYYLLCYAWNKLDESERINVAQMECETLIDLLTSVLANGAAYVLRRGLDRGAVAVDENVAGGGAEGILSIPALTTMLRASPFLRCSPR